MFGAVISASPGRRKDGDWWIDRKKIEETKGTEVDVPLRINGTGKTDRPGRYGVLQVVLFFRNGKFLKI